jgi:DNA-binding CsgD family transcriptional regulator
VTGGARRMCPPRSCNDVVLSATLDFLKSMANGQSAENALCTGIARHLRADAVAQLVYDQPTKTGHLIVWPDTLDLVSLRSAVDRLSHLAPVLLAHSAKEQRASCLLTTDARSEWPGRQVSRVLRQGLGFEQLAQVSIEGPPGRVRLVILARHHDFDPLDVQVLRRLRDPLCWLMQVTEHQSARSFADYGCPSDPGLSTREIDVLTLVAQGLMARTIAARLEVSPRTVHKHLGSAYRKLDAHDRLVAVRRAEGLGLLSENRGDLPSSEPILNWALRW